MDKTGKNKITLTKLNIMLWAVAVIAVVVLVFGFCHTAKTSSARLEVDDRIDVTPTIITSMKSLSSSSIFGSATSTLSPC